LRKGENCETKRTVRKKVVTPPGRKGKDNVGQPKKKWKSLDVVADKRVGGKRKKKFDAAARKSPPSRRKTGKKGISNTGTTKKKNNRSRGSDVFLLWPEKKEVRKRESQLRGGTGKT